MKIRYFFLIIISLILCSGCSVEYNLDIDSKLNLAEEISINSNDSNDISRIKALKNYYPISYSADKSEIFEKKTDGVSYYDVKKNSTNTNVDFAYNYDLKSYSDNVFVKNCYEYATLMNYFSEEDNRNELILSTSSKFLCFDYQDTLDAVTIKVHTKRKVYNNNADEVKNDTYIWKINRDNKNDKSIIMSMESSLVDDGLPFWEKNAFLIVLGCLVIIGLLVYYFMNKRSKRVDKI